MIDIKTALKDLFRDFERRLARADIPTGVPALVLLAGGLREASVTLVTGASGSGKTALATTIVRTASAVGHPVLYVTVDMPIPTLTERLLVAEAKSDVGRIRMASLTREDMTAMTVAADALSRRPIILESCLDADAARGQIIEWATGVRADGPIGLAVVDGLAGPTLPWANLRKCARDTGVALLILLNEEAVEVQREVDLQVALRPVENHGAVVELSAVRNVFGPTGTSSARLARATLTFE